MSYDHNPDLISPGGSLPPEALNAPAPTPTPTTITETVRSPRSSERAPVENLVQIWFCSGCSKMIRPAGSPGTLQESGRRFCAECLPFEVANSPPTVAMPALRVPSSRRAMGLNSSGRTKVAGAGGAAEFVNGHFVGTPGLQGASASSRKLLRAGMAAVAALLLLVIGVFLKGGARSTKESQPVNDPVVLKTLKLPGAPDVAKATPAAPKFAAPSPAKVLSEKEERQAALMRSGLYHDDAPVERPIDPPHAAALFPAPSSGVPGTSNAPALPGLASGDLPAELPSTVKSDAQPNVFQKAQQFDEGLRALVPLLAEAKTAEAAGLLDSLEVTYSGEPWFASRKDELAQLREKLESARKSGVLGADDEQRLAAFGAMFEKLERLKKPRLTKAESDASLRALQELKGKLALDGPAIDKYAERLGRLDLELKLAHGPERLFYNLTSCGADNCELKFDFSFPEQAAAWSYSGVGEHSGALNFESMSKALVLQASGEQGFGKQQHPPMAQIPFYFSRTNWSVEAELSMLKTHEHDKAHNPSYGIFVSDGGSGLIRFGASELAKGVLSMAVRDASVKEAERDRQAHVPGKQEDKLRLRMDCKNGVLKFGVTAGVPASSGQLKLTFLPKFAGIFLETRDKDESASLAVSLFKVSGTWDKEVLRKAIEARRLSDGPATKAELQNAHKALVPPVVK